MTWDPLQYLRHEADRLRPALELIARIPLTNPLSIVDLGCGAGGPTAHLARRYPNAVIVGVDSSPEMLAAARERLPSVELVEGDLTRWTPPYPVDLIFSNAAIHWADDHATLLPRLLGTIAPGGVLAIQMPRNHDEPTHTAIHRVATSGPWRETLSPLVRTRPVAPPVEYHAILADSSSSLDIWETTYLHALTGEDPVYDWVRGSVLRPLAEALDGTERAEFESRCRVALREAYPARPDRTTVMAFRRIFIVAVV